MLTTAFSGNISEGMLTFFVPLTAPGRWAFACAMIRNDTGRFIREPLSVEVSNGFNLNPVSPTETPTVAPTSAPTGTPIPNYLELEVPPASGGFTFSPGSVLTLNWHAYPAEYNIMNTPLNLYLRILISPPTGLENRTATIQEIMNASGSRMLFYPALGGPHSIPPAIPAWTGVVFTPSTPTSGSFTFAVPRGVGQKCVFVGAFAPFPIADTCEASNSFTLSSH